MLAEWFKYHVQDPYPTTSDKVQLAMEAGLTVKQVEHWFTNQRKRKWRRKAGDHESDGVIQKTCDGSVKENALRTGAEAGG